MAHDAKLGALVERADPTPEAMEVAGHIRDDTLRKRTEGGVLVGMSMGRTGTPTTS